jgi:hypothetical protein
MALLDTRGVKLDNLATVGQLLDARVRLVSGMPEPGGLP